MSAPELPFIRPMSLFTHLGTTQSLDELIAALALNGETQLPVEGEGTTLYQYAFSEACTETVTKAVTEILRIVGTNVLQ